jgi:broad specificity phosphatase PhoE
MLLACGCLLLLCCVQEGRPRQECYTPEVLAQIQADNWDFAAPGGESQKQLEDRMVRECVRCVRQGSGFRVLALSLRSPNPGNQTTLA